MTRLTLNKDDLSQLKAAESVAETVLFSERQALELAEAELPGSAAASVLSGQGAELAECQEFVSKRQTAVRNAELVLQGIQDKRQRFEANARTAEINRRHVEATRLLTIEATAGVQKIQAGLDLLISGYRQLQSATNTARMTLVDSLGWWPEVWTSEFEGHMRRYLAARGGPFNKNTLASQFREILAGPDLNAIHKKTVRDVLGDFKTTDEKAA